MSAEPLTEPLRIAIITGSTRPGRQSETVARWVYGIAAQREDTITEVVDIADQALPLFDEPIPPMAGRYINQHTQKWAGIIASFDAFVFVTPEYNRSTSAALKNALDYLFAEWNDKAAGFVSYGFAGGLRAAEHLRQILGELKIATVRTSVNLVFGEDFEGYATFRPRESQTATARTMLDEVTTWGTALRALRTATKPT